MCSALLFTVQYSTVNENSKKSQEAPGEFRVKFSPFSIVEKREFIIEIVKK